MFYNPNCSQGPIREIALKDGKTLVMTKPRLRTGCSDQEYNTLKNSESLVTHNPVITTVHNIQLVENIPEDQLDVPIDLIVTPLKSFV